MGSLYLTSLADWLRAAGCNVTEYDGWKTRSRSSGGYDSGRPWGVMWHHTASQTSPANDAAYMCNNSSDKPIANLLIARDGGVWVLAAGATNTNGKGGPWKWSRGTVPQDSMNTYAVGMEIANAGTGVEPYPQVQIDAAFAASVAIVKALGLADSDICTHYAYAPTRKIDPATATAVQGPWRPGSCTSSGTWDLNDLIDEHCRLCAGPAPTPPEEDDDVKTPACVLTGDRLDNFVRGNDGVVYHNWWTGKEWSPWESIGGQIQSAPAATGSATTRIDVTGMGLDGNLWHTYWLGGMDRWADWDMVPGGWPG